MATSMLARKKVHLPRAAEIEKLNREESDTSPSSSPICPKFVIAPLVQFRLPVAHGNFNSAENTFCTALLLGAVLCNANSWRGSLKL